MNRFNGRRVRIARYSGAVVIPQWELGQMVDRSQPSISEYESGAAIPPHNVVVRIAAALNVPVDELLTDDGDENDSGGAA